MRFVFSMLTLSLVLTACPGSSSGTDGGVLPAPVVTSLTPASGPQSGGTAVTINGSNFVDKASVKFGTVAATQVVVVSRTQITARTAAFAASGQYAVTVTNSDGRVSNATVAFTAQAAAGRTIEEAVLSNAATASDSTGSTMVKVPVTASVQVGTVTKGPGQGAGVMAKVGYATTVSTPPADADFTWSDAMYVGDTDGPKAGDQLRDTYSGEVSLPGATAAAVDYTVAARFSTDDGATWKIADRDGLANGTQKDQLSIVHVTKPSVDWCKLGGEGSMSPPAITLAPGASGPVVAGQVYKQNVTNQTGAGTGLSGQLGYGAPGSDPSTWTWVDATYSKKTGNGSNEEWSATLPNPGVGTYKFAYRFTQNNGDWSYCDADGLAENAFTEAQAGTLTVSEAAAGIDWCKLGGETVEAPPSVTLLGAAAGPLVFGQVYEAGLTTQSGPGATIVGQLGYGDAGTDPSTWTWAAATYSTKTGSGSNEEWQATLPNPGLGTYKYAYRFQHHGGPWAYCDADGLAQAAFTEAQAGTLIVASPAVGSCNLQFPFTLEPVVGRTSEIVYGRVFVPGVTDVSGQGSGVEMQVGYGPAAAAPGEASWQWFASTFNVDVEGGGDEYQATFTAPVAGTYGYAYRTRLGAGAWSYCDRDGSGNGYDAGSSGVMTVKEFAIDECVLDSASAFTVGAAATFGPVRAKVHVPTLTEPSGGGAGITAEVGYGAIGTAPSTWTNWGAASYESDSTTFDQYRATMTAPAADGTYEVAYRFKLGASGYSFCDKDGVGNGYSSGQAGRLAVQSKAITSCKLETVSAFAIKSGDALGATVSVATTTSDQAGATPGLKVQLGVGPQGDNASASTAWGWRDAAYTSDVSSRDVFAVTVNPAYNANRAVSARASLNDGGTWAYCDLNGSDGGYDPGAQYDVVVSEHTDIQYCNTQFPRAVSIGAGATSVYGQIYDPTLTPDAGAQIRAEFGVGRESEDPGVAWQWRLAPFSGLSGNNNEYAVSYAPVAGDANYAFRFSKNNGVSWCYGDLNGNGPSGTGGFSGLNNNLGSVTP